MDEFMCSDVVRGRSSGMDDFRAKSAGASTFKWFLGHLVEAHSIVLFPPFSSTNTMHRIHS